MSRRLRIGLAVPVAVAATVLLLLAVGAPPVTALSAMVAGSLGSGRALLGTLSGLTPLLLCGAGLCLTFAASLWNIGVEGQITLGAIGCLGLLRAWSPSGPLSSGLAVALSLVAAILCGAAWALVTGLLRVRGRVHEIFSGLGLNFVAQGVCLWLILGPWKRPGMASLSGTAPLPDALRLPALGGRPMSLIGLLLAVAAWGLVWWLLLRTTFGLSLRAVRQNPVAAETLGLAPARRLLAAVSLGGGLAGLAGGLLMAGLNHRLVPSISGNFGYTALLAVLMADLDIRLMPLTSLFFAALIMGSIQLPLQFSLDSSLAGVIQGVFVLAWLAARRGKRAHARGGA